MTNIFSKGFIYEGYKPHGIVGRLTVPDALYQYINKIQVIGSHDFKEGQEVVEGKDYEKRYQERRLTKGEPAWEDTDDYDILRESFRRIVAIPLTGNKEVQEEKEELMDLFDKIQLKKQVFNTCIGAAISKAKLSATLISKEEIEDIISQLEKFKK